MKANDILNKIKNIVGVELSETVELAEITLENGTILVSEEFTKGNAVFIKGEDGEIALPVGEYALEDGRVLSVVEEGIIDSIRESAETEEKEAEEELSEETVAEESTEETELKEEEKEEMQYVTREEFALAMDELKSMIEAMDHKKKKEDMSEQKEESKEETKQEVNLSEEKTAPVKHNPEAEVDNKVNFKIAGSRTTTTMDRVYSKIFNNN
tara:strand:- start:1255 stop:1890 length:636 start_codon:yes stop_codon:yes gene_type:complete